MSPYYGGQARLLSDVGQGRKDRGLNRRAQRQKILTEGNEGNEGKILDSRAEAAACLRLLR
jgi:hypothetical protein